MDLPAGRTVRASRSILQYGRLPGADQFAAVMPCASAVLAASAAGADRAARTVRTAGARAGMLPEWLRKQLQIINHG